MKGLYDLTTGITDEKLLAKIRTTALTFWSTCSDALAKADGQAERDEQNRIVEEFTRDPEIREKLATFVRMPTAEQRVALIDTAGLLVAGEHGTFKKMTQ